ncbi:A-kinase anchor protein 13-like isoform X1, partial [Lates japonicus]
MRSLPVLVDCNQRCIMPKAQTWQEQDVHPDKEECVSVCVLHRDSDSLNVSAELDDSVFKKPDPPPSVGHRDRGVRVSLSSTDESLLHGAHSPSEGAWSVGSPDDAVSQSSRLSWKSETEDR